MNRITDLHETLAQLEGALMSPTPYCNGAPFPASAPGTCGFSGLPIFCGDQIRKMQRGFNPDTRADLGVHYVHERFVNVHGQGAGWFKLSLTSHRAYEGEPLWLVNRNTGEVYEWDGTLHSWNRGVTARRPVAAESR